MALNNQGKIIVLWSVFLFGILFHTQLGLMPLFYGESVAMSGTKGVANVFDLWLMLGFFALPMIAIVGTAFINSKRYKVIHFGLTLFYLVMNFLHVIFDLLVKPIAWYQITLMVIVLIVGILLNLLAFQWMRENVKYKQQGKQLLSHDS
ncbi:hypothetical protein [Merismopedia glauca]|uniref:Uncharacterized protein n=1 Tax=Merismopedia glauca CCAP 1448/3 TaxID=1296344 RepID=A0A2T1C1A5_9CYAN|nr:hypothetical protein [Merismopedia glauca]PSB01984.1 hypothetical protein C7B64_15410 [Merismopedia glauca CCAP 1448/3]